MPLLTLVPEPDPGSEASDEAKVLYYYKNFNAFLVLQCVEHGVTAPLLVCKRTDDGGGVLEWHFANEPHMRIFFHKIMGVAEMDADMDTILETACEMCQDDDEAGVSMKQGEPFAVVWEFPTYAALAQACYPAAQETGVVLTQQEQEDKELQTQILVAVLRARQAQTTSSGGANNVSHYQNLAAMMGQAQQSTTQSIQNMAMATAEAGQNAADAFGPTFCNCYRSLGYNCPDCIRNFG